MIYWGWKIELPRRGTLAGAVGVSPVRVTEGRERMVAVAENHQEEKRSLRERELAAEFIFSVLREDIGQVKAEVARLADRQDAHLRAVLDRQDQACARLEERLGRLDEKLDRKVDFLYRVVAAVLVTALGSLVTGLISLALH